MSMMQYISHFYTSQNVPIVGKLGQVDCHESVFPVKIDLVKKQLFCAITFYRRSSFFCCVSHIHNNVDFPFSTLLVCSSYVDIDLLSLLMSQRKRRFDPHIIQQHPFSTDYQRHIKLFSVIDCKAYS